MDEGALVVDVKEETDTKEIPPCMILKSDGASLYDTTDLATLVQRDEGLSSEPYNLCGGQASGAAFCTGIPLLRRRQESCRKTPNLPSLDLVR